MCAEPLENLRELSEVSKDYPSVLPLIGAVLELEEKFRSLEDSKQDKPSAITTEVNPNDLTRGALQQKLHRVLGAAGSHRGIGRRFLIGTPVEQSASVPMTMVLNWQAIEEVGRRF
jgi:hypothetical protein